MAAPSLPAWGEKEGRGAHPTAGRADPERREEGSHLDGDVRVRSPVHVRSLDAYTAVDEDPQSRLVLVGPVGPYVEAPGDLSAGGVLLERDGFGLGLVAEGGGAGRA